MTGRPPSVRPEAFDSPHIVPARTALTFLLVAGLAVACRPATPSQPVVRVLYVLPQDRQFRADYSAAIGEAIASLQGWYRDQLGGKTFALLTSEPEVCRLSRPAAYYREESWFRIMSDLGACAPVSARGRDVVWVVYADVLHACNAQGALGRGTSGVTILPRQDMDGLVGERYFDDCGKEWVQPQTRYVGGAGHELGHAFGLHHPPGCDADLPTCDRNALMSVGYARYPDTYLRPDDKRVLLASPFIR